MRNTMAALLALCLLMVCLTGCGHQSEKDADGEPAQSVSAEEYLASVKAQSDAIKASLEQESLTQTDMNQKAQELCDLWDAALTWALAEAEKVLSADEMAALSAEQTAWQESRTKAAEAAGQDFAGGSMYALVVNMEAANITEARVYELGKLLQ